MFDFKNATDSERQSMAKEIAKSVGDDMFATKKELRHLPEVLKDGEMVIGFSSGLMDNNTWLICLTDSRLIFLDKGMLYGLKQSVIGLEKIASVTYSTGMFFGKIEINLGSKNHKIDNLPKVAAKNLTNLIELQISSNKQQPVPSMTAKSTKPPAQDSYEKLLKLGELKDKGFLTEEEFAIEKRKILANT
jgi:hypothetical protein